MASKRALQKTVTLSSRGGKKVRVEDARDRDFLRLADAFVVEANERLDDVKSDSGSKKRRMMRA